MKKNWLEHQKTSFFDYKMAGWILLAICLLSSLLAVDVLAQVPDPMNDKTSKSVRAEYAKCRALETPLAKFLCNCRVVDQQCEAARHPEHGAWKTVEFWPSERESDREVQFILFMDYDILGGFDVLNTGMVFTCLQGESDFNVFVGEYVDRDFQPEVVIDDEAFSAEFVEDNGQWFVNITDTKTAYSALQASQYLTVEFRDIEAEDVSLEFKTPGFGQVTQGWEKICHGPSS